MRLKAKWIWKKQSHYNVYNQTILAAKVFRCPEARGAVVRITADSWYRLFVNGTWVNDGPCRAWPEHYQYDAIDVTTFLEPGENVIEIIARHWGAGHFHGRPLQAGLLAQLVVQPVKGKPKTIITDGTWDVTEVKAWRSDTPKISCQNEPQEYYDARLENRRSFASAEVLFPADGGPWKDLHPRDVALLTKKPLPFRTFAGANLVRHRKDLHLCVPIMQILYPGLTRLALASTTPVGLVTVLKLKQRATLRFDTNDWRIAIDGKEKPDNAFILSAGTHLLTAFISHVCGSESDREIRIVDPPAALRFMNPVKPKHENPWCVIRFPEYEHAGIDMSAPDTVFDVEMNEKVRGYENTVAELLPRIDSMTRLEALGRRPKCMPSRKMFVIDTHWPFRERDVTGNAGALVEHPDALIYDNGETTTVKPSKDGDIELVYDLGEQSCGYYNIDLVADEGVEVDIFSVEYIRPDGVVQHTQNNRNGMRYVTRRGTNSFLSTRRRSGRYVYITLRKQKSPITIRNIRLIESTYPVDTIGSFTCSDMRLDRIWDISAHTLKLCMEDTLTDCPLYEQTLWVGDARNESLYAYPTFGAADIGRRCITLAGQSLTRYPITGCQVPSSWDCLLPAWSFLWGISVWEYYHWSGDTVFLKKVWKWVVKNLKGAETLTNDQGLFSGPFWNMFDWSGVDQNQQTVLHNSMFLVGAIDAARKCAEVLDEGETDVWLRKYRARIVRAVNRLWDTKKTSYPDAIHPDGRVSRQTCIHTSFLAILYGIVERKNLEHAKRNTLAPPRGMTQVGSPFAMMFYYEALDAMGETGAIMTSIYDSYLPMLVAGATTVYEVFANSKYSPPGFPTRSHCHAWSASPLHFLPRIVLGIRPTKPGGEAFDISPELHGLSWAKGSVATARGKLSVEWKKTGRTLEITVDAPEGVKVRFAPNRSTAGLKCKLR